MRARVMRWALAGLLGGTALGLAACERNAPMEAKEEKSRPGASAVPGTSDASAQRGERNAPSPQAHGMQEGYTPPPSAVEEGTGGAAGVGGMGEGAPPGTQPPQGNKPLLPGARRGPGSEGEQVGTGAAPDSPLYGLSGRSTYRGPEPSITPPNPAAIAPSTPQQGQGQSQSQQGGAPQQQQ